LKKRCNYPPFSKTKWNDGLCRRIKLTVLMIGGVISSYENVT
jgi:hypothetical protein